MVLKLDWKVAWNWEIGGRKNYEYSETGVYHGDAKISVSSNIEAMEERISGLV